MSKLTLAIIAGGLCLAGVATVGVLLRGSDHGTASAPSQGLYRGSEPPATLHRQRTVCQGGVTP